MNDQPIIAPPIAATDLVTHALAALQAVSHIPQQQQLAALEAAVGILKASTDLQVRLYALGSLINKR